MRDSRTIEMLIRAERHRTVLTLEVMDPLPPLMTRAAMIVAALCGTPVVIRFVGHVL